MRPAPYHATDLMNNNHPTKKNDKITNLAKYSTLILVFSDYTAHSAPTPPTKCHP